MVMDSSSLNSALTNQIDKLFFFTAPPFVLVVDVKEGVLLCVDYSQIGVL